MNKASGGDGILAVLFQTLHDDAVKVLHSHVSKFRKLSSGHRTGKGQFSPIPNKGNAKEYSNSCTTVLISHAMKVILKILQARLQ